MSLVEAGKMGLKEAAEKIGMSYQQTKRKKGSGLEKEILIVWRKDKGLQK